MCKTNPKFKARQR
ncbi:MAG: hypothetical protein B7Z48_06485 [Thiotrichales bacterium 12-47-6]|nr:MAG: hypothetical protein B7Z48_06485 [Thiotrichales bacterium 12-47-6]